MIYETCPLLDELSWIKHGFYGADNPHAMTKGLSGFHAFTATFPKTLFLKQTHSEDIVTDTDDLSKVADASITDKTNLALAVKTADCCPILLVCTQSRLIAAVHAGWRGALNNITGKAVQRLIEHGAKANHIIAAIGPSIAQQSMAVMDDVHDQFMQQQPDKSVFFIPFEDRWKMDVGGIVQQQLKDFGVETVWRSKTDTFTNPDYSSFRRYSKDKTLPDARNIAVIVKT